MALAPPHKKKSEVMRMKGMTYSRATRREELLFLSITVKLNFLDFRQSYKIIDDELQQFMRW